jgi:hypothetical protein
MVLLTAKEQENGCSFGDERCFTHHFKNVIILQSNSQIKKKECLTALMDEDNIPKSLLFNFKIWRKP